MCLQNLAKTLGPNVLSKRSRFDFGINQKQAFDEIKNWLYDVTVGCLFVYGVI